MFELLFFCDLSLLGSGALSQARLPPVKERVGHTGSVKTRRESGLLYVGCQALLLIVLGRVVATSATEELTSLLEILSNRVMTARLVAGLKNIAELAKEFQLSNTYGASRTFGRQTQGPEAERDRPFVC